MVTDEIPENIQIWFLSVCSCRVMTLPSSGALYKCFVCFRFGAGVRDIPPPLGAPPPLITPKPLPRDQHSSPPAPSSFWNPVSLLRSPSNHPLPHIHPYSGHSRPKPPEEEVRRVSVPSQQRPASSQSDSRPPQGPALDRTDPMMVYDQTLQQHRRLVSKLDLEEKKRREAREKGTEWKIRLKQNFSFFLKMFWRWRNYKYLFVCLFISESSEGGEKE